MGTVSFQGLEPYYLPIAQSAKITAVAETLVFSFRVLVAPDQLATIEIPLLRSQAFELLSSIGRALE